MGEIILDRQDLINLVQGTSPSYDAMQIDIISRNGSYTGGFKDDWTWHIQNDISSDELIEIYKYTKEYWYNK